MVATAEANWIRRTDTRLAISDALAPDYAVNHWNCGIKQVTASREFNEEMCQGEIYNCHVLSLSQYRSIR